MPQWMVGFVGWSGTCRLHGPLWGQPANRNLACRLASGAVICGGGAHSVPRGLGPTNGTVSWETSNSPSCPVSRQCLSRSFI